MKEVFIDTVNMETQTVFYADGNINIYPCSFEQGKQIVSGDTLASQKGRMRTEDDGTSHFRPYRTDSGSRYTELYSTDNGEVKETKDLLIVTFRFKKKWGAAKILNLLREEMDTLSNWMNSRNTMTVWK